MNRLLMVVALVLLALPAHAQTQADAPRSLKSATGRQVFVIDATSREWQGRLIKVSPDALDIEGESGMRRFQLSEINRVDAQGDDVLDGVIKGAVFGLVVGAIYAGAFDESPRGSMLASAMVSYGLVGLTLDAFVSNKHTVYRGQPTPKIALTFSW